MAADPLADVIQRGIDTYPWGGVRTERTMPAPLSDVPTSPPATAADPLRLT